MATGDEDVFTAATRLNLSAAGTPGTQMITALHAEAGQTTGVCFSVGELGVPMLSQLTGVELRFATGPNGAAGGTITVAEQSSLGACGISVINQGGEDGATIAANLAIAMAKGVRELTGTDFAVSVTGVTGPAPGSSGAPIGTFFLGLSTKDQGDRAIEIHIAGDRDATKRGAAQSAIDLLGEAVKAG